MTDLLRSTDPWSLLAALTVLLIPAPLGHELGHALAARLVGFRVVRLDLGLLSFRAGAGAGAGAGAAAGAAAGASAGTRWRVARNPRFGSWAVHVMPASPDGVRRRAVAMVAAGPVAAMAAGTGYAALAAVSSGSGPRILLWIGAALAIGDGAVNLVPMRCRSVRSDGWRLWTWFTRPDVMRLRMATSTLLLAAGLGVRPAHWPGTWVTVAAQAPAGPDVGNWAAARYLAFLAARDDGRREEAWSYLAQPLQRVAELRDRQRGALLAEAAVHQAWSLGDPATARVLLDQVPQLAGLGVYRLRAMGAIAYAEGDWARAVVLCDRVLAAPDAADQVGISVALKDWVRTVRTEALRMLAAAHQDARSVPTRGR
jgi:hypothetical protein